MRCTGWGALMVLAATATVAGCGESSDSRNGSAGSVTSMTSITSGSSASTATSATPTPTSSSSAGGTDSATADVVAPTSGAWIDCAAQEWTLPVCPTENRDFLVGTLDLPTFLKSSSVGREVTTAFLGIAAPDPRDESVWNAVDIDAVAYTKGFPEDLGDPITQDCRPRWVERAVRVGEFSTFACASPDNGSSSQSKVVLAWLRPEGFWLRVTLSQYGRGGEGVSLPAELVVDVEELAAAVGEWAFDPTLPSTDVLIFDDARPPENCGPLTQTSSGVTDDVLVTYTVGCQESLRVMDTYLNHPPSAAHGNGAYVDFDGWTCGSSLQSGTRCEQRGILIFYGDPQG